MSFSCHNLCFFNAWDWFSIYIYIVNSVSVKKPGRDSDSVILFCCVCMREREISPLIANVVELVSMLVYIAVSCVAYKKLEIEGVGGGGGRGEGQHQK